MTFFTLQRLAPLQNAPKLTAQSLSEKIQMAEKKREEQLSQKIQKSKRQTKRKKDLIEAQKFAESQKQYSQVCGSLYMISFYLSVPDT